MIKDYPGEADWKRTWQSLFHYNVATVRRSPSMKTLHLLRHAKSAWDDPGLSDRERPLNKRGERDAPIMAQRVNEAGIRPSQIISSPAVRAWTTAKIFAKELGYPAEFLQREDGLYLASLDNLLGMRATDIFNAELRRMHDVRRTSGGSQMLQTQLGNKLTKKTRNSK